MDKAKRNIDIGSIDEYDSKLPVGDAGQGVRCTGSTATAVSCNLVTQITVAAAKTESVRNETGVLRCLWICSADTLLRQVPNTEAAALTI
jgi:hypothetical protein